MGHFAPPIVKAAERLLLDVELAVRGWPRCHKYGAGKDLREVALQLATVATLAWLEPSRRLEHVRALVEGVQRLKVLLQLGKRLQAFRSFGQFDQLARQAHGLGAQAGGWWKDLQSPKAQSPGRHRGPGARHGTEYPGRPSRAKP
ncbi:four helix bundle protein [Arenimonas caeni]|uniref:Four helix bundle protein n=1 Tax=Arenimonas caeni TaxID=2058085 RepID=A0A2P6MA09_9GAMM|nr:four helix bundle protein [Arenimonas caeni]PRH82830.1 hypothetical protein C6N40_06390 [Arenimonas caeni]